MGAPPIDPPRVVVVADGGTGRPGPGSGPPDLSGSRRVHVIGAGGAGMSGLATVLAAMGHRVTGSDARPSDALDRLGSLGVVVAAGHHLELVADADFVTASPAVPPGDPELAEARRRGVPVRARAEVLAAVAAMRRCAAVAGTHGKTTTASMLASVLDDAGFRPSFLVGADVGDLGTNARWDTGEWLVVEADESYGTFVSLRPELGVLTNVEPDHLDHYGTVGALRAAFARYLEASTAALVGADDPVASALGREVGALTVGSRPGATYRITGVALDGAVGAFDLSGPEGPLGRLSVGMPGRHNVANAALAVAAALRIGVAFDDARAALARFRGVSRRMERRGEAGGVTFVDDYAHLPGEVRAALAAARTGGWDRVVAVFQPHRYTRTAASADELGRSFGDADVVVVTDVYGAGDPPVPGVTGQLVADAVTANDPGKSVVYAATRDELRAVLVARLRPGALCCTLGAGDLTTLPDELLAAPAW